MPDLQFPCTIKIIICVKDSVFEVSRIRVPFFSGDVDIAFQIKEAFKPKQTLKRRNVGDTKLGGCLLVSLLHYLKSGILGLSIIHHGTASLGDHLLILAFGLRGGVIFGGDLF